MEYNEEELDNDIQNRVSFHVVQTVIEIEVILDDEKIGTVRRKIPTPIGYYGVCIRKNDKPVS